MCYERIQYSNTNYFPMSLECVKLCLLISDFESKSFPTTAYHAQKALRFKQLTTLNVFYHLEFGKVFRTALKR